MIIKGKLDEYQVFWREAGWSYAVPVVKKKNKFLCFTCWSKVWEVKHKTAKQADQLTPHQLMIWFNDTVNDYERYAAEWIKFEQEQSK